MSVFAFIQFSLQLIDDRQDLLPGDLFFFAFHQINVFRIIVHPGQCVVMEVAAKGLILAHIDLRLIVRILVGDRIQIDLVIFSVIKAAVERIQTIAS